MDRYRQHETFIAVVEAGSLTAAADRLEVAKSAISRRLGELERRLGVQLLERTTRRLSLTDSGRLLYERSRRLIDDLEDAELSVSEEHCALAGRIRIAGPLSFGHRHLTDAVDDFLATHPELELEIDLNDRMIDLLEEGFDVAIRIAELEDSTLIARRLAQTRHVVCASPGYLEGHGRPQTLDDLAKHRCLVYSNAPRPGLWRYRDGRSDQAISVHVTHRANSGDFLRKLAINGHGLIMEPDFILYESIERGELEIVLGDIEWLTLGIYAVTPPTRYPPRRVKAFIDFLSERFAGVPYWQQCLEGLEPRSRPDN